MALLFFLYFVVVVVEGAIGVLGGMSQKSTAVKKRESTAWVGLKFGQPCLLFHSFLLLNSSNLVVEDYSLVSSSNFIPCPVSRPFQSKPN